MRATFLFDISAAGVPGNVLLVRTMASGSGISRSVPMQKPSVRLWVDAVYRVTTKNIEIDPRTPYL